MPLAHELSWRQYAYVARGRHLPVQQLCEAHSSLDEHAAPVSARHPFGPQLKLLQSTLYLQTPPASFRPQTPLAASGVALTHFFVTQYSSAVQGLPPVARVHFFGPEFQ